MIKVYGADVEFMKFNAGEPHVKVTNVDTKFVRILWNFENFEEFISVAMIASVVNATANKVVLEMPYVPFARQDRATTPEQPFSLDVFCSMLKTLQIDTLAISDVHSDMFFVLMKKCDFEIVPMSQLLCALMTMPIEYLMQDYTPYDCIIAPDKGAEQKAKWFGKGITLPLVCATKVRDPLTGQLSSPTIDFGDLEPNRALIPDDILDYGGTFIQLATEIKKQKPNIKLDLYVTHGLFGGGIDKYRGLFDNIYCYNIMNKEIKSGDLVNL